MKRILVTLLCVLLIFALASCTTCPPTVPIASISPTDTVQAATEAAKPADTAASLSLEPVVFKPADSLKPAVAKALGGFSLDMFQRQAKADPGKNVFLSPLSVWLALCMTYNGASGSTAQGMAEALHATGISLGDINADNAALMGVLTAADPAVKIALANSIWMRKSFEPHVRKDFLDCNRLYYAAEIKGLDFSDPGAAGVINKWVEDNTEGRIQNLVEPPIHPLTLMFLVNALYFKAPWQIAFDPQATRDGLFQTSRGGEARVKYLSSEKGNAGFFDEDVVAARIPYASGRLEFVALMPQKQALAEFISGLTTEKLVSWISRCEKTELSLLLPKFKAEYEVMLNDVLKAMGMEEAFSDNADFSAIDGDKDLYISKVKHKSFIEITEEGTEAAAATSVEIRWKGPPKTLKFDKPFVYLIRDTKTGAILFIGTFENPEEAQS